MRPCHTGLGFHTPRMAALDWQYPWILALAVPALAWLLWAEARSVQPLAAGRRRALLVVRALLVLTAIVALASPARVVRSSEQAVMLVVDQSRSLGDSGLTAARSLAASARERLPAGVPVGVVVAGAESRVLAVPGTLRREPWDWAAASVDGSRTDLSGAIRLAEGLFPAGVARHVVLVTDGQENRGSLEEAARRAAAGGLRLHALAVAGEARPDARVTSLVPSQTQITEGATVELAATIESSLAGAGRLRLFENGLQVEERALTLAVGQTQVVTFTRSPELRNSYTYRAVVEGMAGDAIPENNEALALVDVRGKPLLLYVEGEPSEARYLAGAMEAMGLRLQVRTPETMPQSLRELNGYDAVILSDVPARALGEDWMASLREYVGRLGGGLVMIGGRNSFGVGGYYRTPVEELLPVKLQAPDQEEQQSSALALVMDRSGSMSGPKLEFCKAAAATTAELLTAKDYLGVYAFDSAVTVVVPMSRVPASGGGALAGPIAGLTAGGGTNIQPGMVQARADLAAVKAKIKHMIVLTDGQSGGTGYEALAASMRAEGITISTVAVGGGRGGAAVAGDRGSRWRAGVPDARSGVDHAHFHPGHDDSHRPPDPRAGVFAATGRAPSAAARVEPVRKPAASRIRQNQPQGAGSGAAGDRSGRPAAGDLALRPRQSHGLHFRLQESLGRFLGDGMAGVQPVLGAAASRNRARAAGTEHGFVPGHRRRRNGGRGSAARGCRHLPQRRRGHGRHLFFTGPGARVRAPTARDPAPAAIRAGPLPHVIFTRPERGLPCAGARRSPTGLGRADFQSECRGGHRPDQRAAAAGGGAADWRHLCGGRAGARAQAGGERGDAARRALAVAVGGHFCRWRWRTC
jgi:hypothetical protein